MVSYPSTHKVLWKDKSFDALDGTRIAGFALYCEWVDDLTLADWLRDAPPAKVTEVERKDRDDDSISFYADNERNEDTNNNMDGTSVDTTRTYANDGSALLLDKVHVAHGLANAVANIHEAGIIHNNLDKENVIISFQSSPSPIRVQASCRSIRTQSLCRSSYCLHKSSSSKITACKVTIIHVEYGEKTASLEKTDVVQQVNNDIPHLASLLKNLFTKNKWSRIYTTSIMLPRASIQTGMVRLTWINLSA